MRIWESRTIKEKVGCGRNLYVTIGRGENGKRVIIWMGKSGQCHRAIFEGLQNLINLLLYNGGNTEDVIRALKHIRCESPTLGGASSCVDFIARILESDEDVVGKV